MKLALVTGATGFIGAHVLRAVLDAGAEARAIARPGSDRANLDGLDVEVVDADLTDPDSLDRALAGVDTLFHVAARYDLARRARRDTWQANVLGADHLMRAALRHQVDRIVHTSSVAAIGSVGSQSSLADEQQWADASRAPGPYERTKIVSERLVHRMVAAEGLPAVVVNPTAPIGPLDRKPTPTGRLIADAAGGRMPAYISSAGLNIVHVADVARGHILAAERGRIGQRYILGHAEGNLTLREIITRAAVAAGANPPNLAIPWQVAYAWAAVDEAAAVLAHRTPRATIAGVRISRRRQWYDVSKAINELGLPQTPLDQAFADAAAWFSAYPPGHSHCEGDARTTDVYRRWYDRAFGIERARRALDRSSAFAACAVATRAMSDQSGRGVSELRIHHGPGYRVYFTLSVADSLVIL